MKHKQSESEVITTRIAGTKYYTFNIPEVGERIILIHNPYNKFDESAIVVLNAQLQQIGHLTKTAGFNKKVGKLIDWQPYTAKVVAVFPQFSEIFIEINTKNNN